VRTLSELERELGPPVARRVFERLTPSWVQAYECGCELLADVSSEYSWLRVCEKHEALAGVDARHKFSDELRSSLTPNARILLTIIITVARPPNRFISAADLTEFLERTRIAYLADSLPELLASGYIAELDSNYVITPHLTEALFLDET